MSLGAMFRRLLYGLGTLVALAAAPAASACGQGGYAYAGVAAPTRAYGVSAVVTPLATFGIHDGHVAGWVGVGGPRQGVGGADEWLQVGFNGLPQAEGSSIYYELTLPHAQPTYHAVRTNVAPGTPARLSLLEMQGRRDYWRVWVNGSPVSQPIRLPGSHGRWAPIVTAESWDGGTASTCNAFLFRFDHVAIAAAPGGSWRSLVGGDAIRSSTSRLVRRGASASFVSAQGPAALRTLATLSR
jgi:hypothetical protein